MSQVLVVDDQASNRELICTLLTYSGHKFSEAADGAEALERVRAERPDLVVCDILMPTMDGYEFVRQLRADPQIAHTEVIFYTATFMEREARSLARSCGVSHVLSKPCEPQEILSTIEQALNRLLPMPDLPVETANFDREHMRLLTDKLIDQTGELRSANLRLSALTELNLNLASEHDPYALLDKVCRGARELIGARYAILGVRHKNSETFLRFSTWGLSPDVADRLNSADVGSGLVGQVLQERVSRRFLNPQGDPTMAGLPATFPPLHCGLIAPIISLQHAYGWIVLADKLGGDAFTEEDENLLAIHAAQAGRIYENGSLYRAMKHNAEQLQIEINERKRAAQELHIANETLEQRVEQRTAELREIIEGLESFNRTVSHDLLGPLGGIAGVARLARECVAEGDSAEADRLLERITISASTSEKLVGALLAMARTSEAVLQPQRIDTQAMVAEVISSLQAADAALPLPVSVGTLPPIEGDVVLLRQVFVNLIVNALKFAGQVAQPRIEVGVTGDTARTVFFVHDNGVGFSAAQAERMFKPFQRLHGVRFEGSGLGLSIVKRIIDRHGGEVWAEGETGKGATFFFTLGKSLPVS